MCYLWNLPIYLGTVLKFRLLVAPSVAYKRFHAISPSIRLLRLAAVSIVCSWCRSHLFPPKLTSVWRSGLFESWRKVVDLTRAVIRRWGTECMCLWHFVQLQRESFPYFYSFFRRALRQLQWLTGIVSLPSYFLDLDKSNRLKKNRLIAHPLIEVSHEDSSGSCPIRLLPLRPFF